ncbi:hypothetical protein Dimus_032015 [Dionaea muscipula]
MKRKRQHERSRTVKSTANYFGLVLFHIRSKSEIWFRSTTRFIWFRSKSEISLPIMREPVPHYLQDSGKERPDYLEDGKNVFKLRKDQIRSPKQCSI